MQIDDIARRLWEGGIPEKLIKYYIPLQFLGDEKMETPLEPFQVGHHYYKASFVKELYVNALQVEHLLSGWFSLGIGLSLAILAFVAEAMTLPYRSWARPSRRARIVGVVGKTGHQTVRVSMY